jgi:hypothetical protein
MKTLYKKFFIGGISDTVIKLMFRRFLSEKTYEFVDYASATSTTENLYSLLNGIHRSLYIRYEGKMKLGLQDVCNK